MTGPSPTLPVRIGRYELVEHLATGGMAEVFLARSHGAAGFRKHVVVKRLRPGLAHAPRVVQLFVQEARISAGLCHPNIVQIHELGLVGSGPAETHFIAMEYIHGADLTRVRRALAAQGRTLPVALAVHALVRVLRALAHAHGRVDAAGRPLGLVHRDVSPHNVLVSFQGEVKLVDFGIARVEGDVAGDPAGLPGGGKYAYMSPEQAVGAPLTDRSDVFSAGIVLWELLAGRRLYQHADPQEKLRMVRQARVPDVRAENPAVSAGLWSLLQAMLDPEVARRPSAAQAEDALQAQLFDEGHRADSAALGSLVRELFPDRAARDPGALDLTGLAEDLARLEPVAPTAAGDDATGSLTGGTVSGEHALSTLPALRGLRPGERKPVVVLVAEISGLTEPSTRHDAEVIVRAHYRLLRRIRGVVDRHGGWLDRFHDDRFTVFFGLPRTAEHDVDHALACAAQLVRGARRVRRRGLGVSLSVGVHQGELAIGRLPGKGARGLRYLPQGDTTKLATRLCQAADLDEVVVSERVRALARDRFCFRPGPDVQRRGEGDPLPSWRLVGRDTDVRASAGRWLARGDELDVLGRAMRRVAQGERVVVAIRGPAGTGKSRLLQELRDVARLRGVPVHAARAVPYAADRPLATLRDLVARVLDIPAEADAQALARGLGLLAELGLDADDLQAFALLFGAGSPAEGDRVLPDLVLAAGRFVRRLALGRPTILAIEDGQHLSQVERGVLEHVLSVTADVPVLMLLTVRDEVPAGLGPADEEVVLGPLPPVLQRGLAAHLLGANRLQAGLAELVERSSEGNPRFIAALVDALRDGRMVGVLDGEARLLDADRAPPLPEDLEGLVAARIDALSPAARQALQLAVVIGRNLSAALLEQAGGGPDMAPVLGELVDRGLLVREGGILSFSNELAFEVANRGLLAARRRELHGVVATALEALTGGDGPHAGQLAYHCASAGRLLDAARHGHAAGDHLRRQQLVRPATRYWLQALDHLTTAEGEGADPAACLQGEALLHWKLGEARALLGESDEARRHLEAALDAANEREDPELEALALLELGRLHAAQGRSARARLHWEAARDATERPGPEGPWRRQVAVGALEALGLLAHEHGDHDQAQACFDAALARAGDDDGLAARALLGLANRFIRQGEEERALALLSQAEEKAILAGDRILRGRVVNNRGLVHHGAGRGDPARYGLALACFEEAQRLRRDTGYRRGEAVNLHNTGDTLVRMGQLARAWGAFERSRDLAQAIGWTRGVVMNDLWMAWLEASRTGLDPDAVAAAAAQAQALGDLETAATGRWLLGRLLRERGQEERGLRELVGALEQARALGAAPLRRDIEETLEATVGA
ncbi:protein kinase [Myxococcota bacterium]|nr:protein kinase [Myxococcota bacterium]